MLAINTKIPTSTSTSSFAASSSSKINSSLQIPNTKKPEQIISKPHSCISSAVNSKNYLSPIKNKYVNPENKFLKQTLIYNNKINPNNRGRSSSIDSDFGDYTIHGAVSGLFPRNAKSSTKYFNRYSRRSCTSKSMESRQDKQFVKNIALWKTCVKLPSLEGCSADQKCCVKPYGSNRTLYELEKYKNTLKNT